MRAILAAAALATTVVVTPLTAQDGSSLAGRNRQSALGAQGIDQRLATRFPSSVALRIGALVDSARQEGLPTEPLVLRALEGGAKGVPAERIQVALQRLRIGLQRAVTTLGATAPTTDLVTAASALQTGLEPDKLVELRNIRGDRSLTVPLGAYLDLVAQGAVPDRAWQRVLDLARRQVADREYERIDPADLVARHPEDRR